MIQKKFEKLIKVKKKILISKKEKKKRQKKDWNLKNLSKRKKSVENCVKIFSILVLVT